MMYQLCKRWTFIKDDMGLPVDLSTTFRLYSVWLSCLQELTSWGGLWGGTYTLVYDIKERLEDLWAEHLFLPFSLCRTTPPPWLETALHAPYPYYVYGLFINKTTKGSSYIP